MPGWALQIIVAVIPQIVKVLFEKFAPEKRTPKRLHKVRKRIIDGMERYRGKTIEDIARMGRED